MQTLDCPNDEYFRYLLSKLKGNKAKAQQVYQELVRKPTLPDKADFSNTEDFEDAAQEYFLWQWNQDEIKEQAELVQETSIEVLPNQGFEGPPCDICSLSYTPASQYVKSKLKQKSMKLKCPHSNFHFACIKPIL